MTYMIKIVLRAGLTRTHKRFVKLIFFFSLILLSSLAFILYYAKSLQQFPFSDYGVIPFFILFATILPGITSIVLIQVAYREGYRLGYQKAKENYGKS